MSTPDGYEAQLDESVAILVTTASISVPSPSTAFRPAARDTSGLDLGPSTTPLIDAPAH